MPRKKKEKVFEDPLHSDEEILGQFFSPSFNEKGKESGGKSTSPKGREEGPKPEPAYEAEAVEGLESYIDDFLQEFEESTASMKASIQQLGKNPKEKNAIVSLFRNAHNLKGGANAMGFARLGEFAGQVEASLHPAKKQGEDVSRNLHKALTLAVEALEGAIGVIRSERSDSGIDFSRAARAVGDALVKANRPGKKERVVEKENLVQHIQAFIQELDEYIERMDASIFLAEKNPNDPESFNSIFRVLHNVKGICDSLGYARFQKLSHALENTLTAGRKENRGFDGEFQKMFFEFTDLLRHLKASLLKGSGEDEVDTSSLFNRLEGLPGASEHKKPEDFNIPPTPPLDEERRKVLDSYMPDFLQEYEEQIEALESCVMNLERNPGDTGEVNNMFRQIHTLKGSANALGFMTLGYLCHAAESSLTVYREKKLALEKETLSWFFEFNDTLRRFKRNIASTYTEGDIDITPALRSIKDVSTALNRGVKPILERAAPEHKENGQAPAPEANESAAFKSVPASMMSVTERISTIRVNVDRLDNLMNSVGELVLLRNRFNQLNHDLLAGGITEALIDNFNTLSNQLDMVTRNLQSFVMRSRMLPVGNIFNKFNRVVRDLSQLLEKKVELVISGAETELDKNLLEAISDPLMHVIRNCVDHGIEKPAERERGGKPLKGTINLNAWQEGNSIVIEIRDDGKGIDRQRLADKAVQNGIIDQETADKMGPNEKLALIFTPGVSTAESITDISGRGVGMDVLKTNIEKLKGRIDIDTVVNKGVRIQLRIPLTLAIMQTLLCKAGDRKFSMPLFSVDETVRIDPGAIESASGSLVIRIRDEVLPVRFLGEVLGFDAEHLKKAREVDVVVVKTGLSRLGLVVEKTLGQEEILIKPMDSLKGIYNPEFISGATILGDGSIAFILDLSQIADTFKTIDSERRGSMLKKSVEEPEEIALLLSDGGQEQYGVTLNGVANISVIDSHKVEYVGGLEVVRLGGKIIPVTRLCHITGFEPPPYKSQLYLVVFRNNGRNVGLLVNDLKGLKKIASSQVDQAMGSLEMDEALIVNNQVTIILDPAVVAIRAVQKKAHKEYHPLESCDLPANESMGKTILVVDDSSTTREMISATLTKEGYRVVTAGSGEEGLELLEGVDAVLSDLDMPGIDGLQFARAVKEATPAMPIVILTNYASENEKQAALDAGADSFLTKYDPQQLLAVLNQLHWIA